jgi:bifunctional UDP-N-acetylglucosamine pyrophosphorylase / glucosamine-1-phosphate N-acetyltransferase
VFILAGDVPLIRAEVLKTLLNEHRSERADASMATAILDNPTGYGRIVRDGDGNFQEIVEQIDCTPEQREIREVFPSYYCVRVNELLAALAQLKNDNKKGEYYLTDIYAILRRAGKKVLAIQAVKEEDVLAPNSRHELALADAAMQERIQKAHRENGVTIVSTVGTYVEDGVQIGAETVIQPFTFIGRDAVIGGECVIGPHAVVPRSSVVQEGAVVSGNVSPETAGLQ